MMDRRLFLRMIAGAVAGSALGPQVLDLVESLPEPELLACQDELAQLCHDIFVGRVAENVKRQSPLVKLFYQTSPEQFPGQNLTFYTDLRYAKSNP